MNVDHTDSSSHRANRFPSSFTLHCFQVEAAHLQENVNYWLQHLKDEYHAVCYVSPSTPQPSLCIGRLYYSDKDNEQATERKHYVNVLETGPTNYLVYNSDVQYFADEAVLEQLFWLGVQINQIGWLPVHFVMVGVSPDTPREIQFLVEMMIRQWSGAALWLNCAGRRIAVEDVLVHNPKNMSHLPYGMERWTLQCRCSALNHSCIEKRKVHCQEVADLLASVSIKSNVNVVRAANFSMIFLYFESVEGMLQYISDFNARGQVTYGKGRLKLRFSTNQRVPEESRILKRIEISKETSNIEPFSSQDSHLDSFHDK